MRPEATVPQRQPGPRRGWTALARAAGLAIGLVLAVAALWLGTVMIRGERPPRLVLTEVAFDRIAGWRGDDHAAALTALARSCARSAALPADRRLDGDPRLGVTAGDLVEACRGIEDVAPADARAFFEARFVAFRVRNGRRTKGLFTGYYEPEVEGSRSRSAEFLAPLLRRPDDLVSVDLGAFRDALRGQRIAGRVENGRLVPYEDRAAIAAGALDRDALALVWLRDEVEAFFLQIQGSGRVLLADGPDSGQVIRLSYAGQNGHPYTPVGRVLIERGEIAREAMSMAAIRDWMRSRPDEAAAVMNANASYVFFAELPVEEPDMGPPGAEGVLLTPGRSLAVDRSFHALGLPVWVDLPGGVARFGDGPVRRVMIAQDTGGAIRGPVRGDLFVGIGDRAGATAGAMREDGTLIALLPRAVAQRAREIDW